jgi:alpha-tubulin suppressor-like RCC1 family protein
MVSALGGSCALDVQGAAYCWGPVTALGGAAPEYENCNGSPCATRPTRIAAPRLTSITAGTTHVCGLDRTHRAICWGGNRHGEMGTGGTDELLHAPHHVAPTYRFTQLSAGGRRTCGVTSGGELVCWGDNEGGAVNPLIADRFVAPHVVPMPAAVMMVSNGTWFPQSHSFGQMCVMTVEAKVYCWRPPAQPTLVSAPVDFIEVSAGTSIICGRSAAGEVYCWGNRHPITAEPFRIPGSFQSVAAGLATACGVTLSGELQCWGWSDDLIRIASAQPEFIMPPVQIPLPTSAVAVSVGSSHACVLDGDARLFCWGSQGRGSLGNGSYAPHILRAPVQVLAPRS